MAIKLVTFKIDVNKQVIIIFNLDLGQLISASVWHWQNRQNDLCTQQNHINLSIRLVQPVSLLPF